MKLDVLDICIKTMEKSTNNNILEAINKPKRFVNTGGQDLFSYESEEMYKAIINTVRKKNLKKQMRF